MNLVDEEHLAGLEVRQDGGKIARLLEHRTRGGTNGRLQLVPDHIGKRRLPEPRRTVEQDVIERFTALQCCGNRHVQVLAHAVLADVLVERARAQTRFVLRVLIAFGSRGQSLVHRLPRQLAKSLTKRTFEIATLGFDGGVDGFLGKRTVITQIHQRRQHIISQRGRLNGTAVRGWRVLDPRQPIFQLEDDALGRLLPDSRNGREPR